MEQCKQKIINKYYNEFEKFISLKKIIFGLKEENIIQCADSIINKFDENYPLSFHILISNLICTAFTLKNNEFSLYFNFIKQFDILEKNNGNKSKFSDVFINFLVDKNTRESIYFLENLIEQNFVEPKLVQDIFDPYFLHYMSSKYLNKINVLLTNENLHLEDLSANDFELQKKYAKEGVNPGEIAKIIRNDEIKKLQEISSQTNFDFNQLIKFSYYERCSFVNKRDVTLIDYAAFFSSVKCFKYLLMNGSNVEKTGKYAVAGGNLEIIHLCERNHSTFEGAYEAAIEFHRNDIFKYIYENKLEEITSLEELGRICIRYCNYEILADLFAEGMKINDDIINESAGTGNIYLVKYFLKSNKIPVNILVHSSVSRNIELVDYILEQEGIDINTKAIYFNIFIFLNNIWKLFKLFYTALMEASIKGYTEIVKLLLQQEGIDINDKDI